VVSNRPPNLQETEEKLKNPQEPNTQAPRISRRVETVYLRYRGDVHSFLQLESQEGLKLHVAACAVHYLVVPHVESQEGLKRLCGHVWFEIVS